ncbi:MAG TPA: polysaccharide deacetylase family protein [Candidatus Saccharimonadia bacterium]|nr:polysaccharide deacetylase family protein [Candidatus Saccharimonadia bacterium]
MLKRLVLANNLKNRVSAIVGVAIMLTSSATALVPTHTSADTTSQDTAKVSFTFDDGLSSALLAAQTLHTYGYSATDYVITHCVGMKNPNTCAANGSVDYMSWSDIHSLQDTYGWEIGSHTQTHPLTAAADNKNLTDQQLDQEMSGSQADLAAQGFTATDLASPYGDYDNRSLAVIAKYYASHRAFQDLSYTATTGNTTATAVTGTSTFPYYSPYSSYPYNNYLLTVMEVQGDVSVQAVESAIDQSIANHQWLILVFHNIVSGTASIAKDDYQYSTANLAAIAAYVQSKNLPVVHVHDGLASGTNIMADSAFNNTISTYASPTGSTGWTTDSPSTITNDRQANALNGHGSYDGTAQGPLNSVAIASSASQTHLFSPEVAVTPGTTYTLTNFVNVTSSAGGINFYVDEFDVNGNYVGFQKAVGPTGTVTANDAQVGDVNFKYTPTTSTVAFARIYADIAPSTTGYLDNMQWLAPAGTVTPPVNKPGDINGDNAINAIDLSILSSHWGVTTGATRAQGDLNGDGAVNAIDLSILSSNWGK